MTTRRARSIVWVTALLAGLAADSLWSAPVAQTGFERGDSLWEVYVPVESDSAECAFKIVSVNEVRTHLGTACGALSAKRPARVGVQAKANPVVVVPGEKFRFSTWVKAGRDWLPVPDSPGVVLQCLLRDALQKDLAAGPLFIGLKGVSGAPAKLCGPTLPSQWTKIEGVVQIPAGASEMIPFVFIWKGSGQVFIDDIFVEKVSVESPLTPLL